MAEVEFLEVVTEELVDAYNKHGVVHKGNTCCTCEGEKEIEGVRRERLEISERYKEEEN